MIKNKNITRHGGYDGYDGRKDNVMTKQELKKGVKVWCWWGHRYLYFTGRMFRGEYEFRDDIGALTMVAENKLSELKII